MDYVNLAMGLLLIVMGWLCYRYPNMINPYGGMSPERKALVDIEGLKWTLAIIMTVVGGLLLLTALLGFLKVFDEEVSGILLTVLCLGMIVPLLIAMRRHNGWGRDDSGVLSPEAKKNKAAKAGWAIAVSSIVISIVAIIALFSAGNKPSAIEVGDESIRIDGMYGRDIPLSDIVAVELLEQMPPIAMRTNGSSTGSYNKGHFRLKNGESCLLFIKNQGPYIEIRTTDNLYYFNGPTEEETLRILSDVQDKTHLNP